MASAGVSNTGRDTWQDEAMDHHGLPCLGILAATPGILRGMTCELSASDAQWKPGPDRFSVSEVLAHLSHSEGHCYRLRVDLILAEDNPELQPDEAQMYVDLYRGRVAETELRHFEEQRAANVAFLGGLPPGVGTRTARHREAGVITLSQMLHEWTLHDLGHVRQVAELVRARRYREGAGPLGVSYQLRP
jgi:hypothetical protein